MPATGIAATGIAVIARSREPCSHIRLRSDTRLLQVAQVQRLLEGRIPVPHAGIHSANGRRAPSGARGRSCRSTVPAHPRAAPARRAGQRLVFLPRRASPRTARGRQSRRTGRRTPECSGRETACKDREALAFPGSLLRSRSTTHHATKPLYMRPLSVGGTHAGS
jgi:hypothetical protein